jgi:hypothetical protein
MRVVVKVVRESLVVLVVAALFFAAAAGCAVECEEACLTEEQLELCVTCRDVTLILEKDCVELYCD